MSIIHQIIACLFAGTLGFSISGCSGLAEKKVDPAETKRQMKDLETNLQKERGEQ